MPESTKRFPASFNLRDLGGLPTRTKRAISAGRLYRSADPSELELSEIRVLAEFGFRFLVDLRSTRELRNRSIRASILGCTRLHHPLFESAPTHWTAPAEPAPGVAAAMYLEMLGHGVGALARTLRTLAESDAYPCLIHCAAGRDRTGIVVACLLDLLDVEDDVIASDYALSDGVIEDGRHAHASTMLEFLAALRRRHGSTRELLRAHDVADDVLTKLSSNLLTDGT